MCGGSTPEESLQAFEEHLLCPSCLETENALCEECEERIWQSDDAGCQGRTLCQSCFDHEFTVCIECGALLRTSSAYYYGSDSCDEAYCYDCYSDLPTDDPIQDYYYKPDPIFYGDGPRYFGVELEIDSGGELSANARILSEIANQEANCLYVKHDGSLRNGLELVTHPMSLNHQLHCMPWSEVCQKAVSLGYLSHRTNSCGLHVHVSRMALGETEAQQDSVIARVLYFFEKHWEELLKFSRRTQNQLNQWAARYGYKQSPMEILHYAKKDTCGNRHTCVNLQNDTTVEFRMFRGTLKPNTIFATLQLLNRICDVALFMSDEEITAMAWTTFVSGLAAEQYSELIRYLKERQLYVNEPVEAEVEN